MCFKNFFMIQRMIVGNVAQLNIEREFAQGELPLLIKSVARDEKAARRIEETFCNLLGISKNNFLHFPNMCYDLEAFLLRIN